MTRTDVVAMLRADEQHSIRTLPERPTGSALAYTDVPITRAVYACIEPPPTPDEAFVIRTFWRSQDWTAASHAVYVQHGDEWTPVVPSRPGVFGGTL